MNNPRVGVATIVTDGTKLLLGYRKSELGKNTWGLPGGKLDFGEDLKDCAARELKEETNLTTTTDNLYHVGVTNAIFDNETHYITVIYHAIYCVGKIKVLEPDKCEKWEWFEYNNLPENLFLPLKNFVKQPSFFTVFSAFIKPVFYDD
jgi:8-oxo-dGTP diphosphatase